MSNLYYHSDLRASAVQQSRILALLAEAPQQPTWSVPRTLITGIQNILAITAIRSILYFQLPAGFRGIIHRDRNLDDLQSTLYWATNLPLLHGSSVCHSWYRSLDSALESTFTGPSGTPTPSLESKHAEFISSVDYTQSLRVNIDQWHAVDNLGPDLAKFISIRFAR